MSAAPNKKPSVALGLILILLLLAAVVFGGMWVVQAAFTPRMSDAKGCRRGSFCPLPRRLYSRLSLPYRSRSRRSSPHSSLQSRQQSPA